MTVTSNAVQALQAQDDIEGLCFGGCITQHLWLSESHEADEWRWPTFR